MSSTEADRVEQAIERFSGRNLKLIVCITFAAAVWAATIKFDAIQIQKELEHIKASQDNADAQTTLRVGEWAAWRKGVDTQLDTRLQDRYTATDYRWTAILFNMANPPVRLPEWDTVKKSQP